MNADRKQEIFDRAVASAWSREHIESPGIVDKYDAMQRIAESEDLVNAYKYLLGCLARPEERPRLDSQVVDIMLDILRERYEEEGDNAVTTEEDREAGFKLFLCGKGPVDEIDPKANY